MVISEGGSLSLLGVAFNKRLWFSFQELSLPSNAKELRTVSGGMELQERWNRRNSAGQLDVRHHIHLFLTEFEVCTASYAPSFSP